ncbi:MAG TPA: ISNCY family transposase [Nitrospirota bacterium]|nr:ISNCY family transposase [Nitrospirota bacterium]
MGRRGTITMSMKEAKLLHVVRQALEKRITQAEAAGVIGLSLRQVQRVVRRVKREGDEGICHRARGKEPNNRIPEKVKDKVLKLCRGIYYELGPTHAGEKLLEKDQVKVSVETLRTWFIEEGLPYRQRKKRPHRQWRERKSCRGEMVQLDGSHHDWFEGRGPVCVLMAYVDDATGAVFARFSAYEGTLPAMDSFKSYIRRYGVPQSVYLDRHSTYKSTEHYQTIEDQLEDRQLLSQFERSLRELGVKVIHAYSPQAKGRVERLFGTFQDRVIKEMRLAGVKNREEGNRFLKAYLPTYNRRFGVMPAKEADLHRPFKDRKELDRILSIRNTRALRNDFTVAHNKKLYQIKDNIRTKTVLVEERTDGSMRIVHNGQRLRYKEIKSRPVQKVKKPMVPRVWKGVKPAADHPWKVMRAFARERRESASAAL